MPQRWVLTFPGRPGAHEEQETVVVHLQGGVTGPQGHPLYADAERGVRAEITAEGMVFLLDCDGLPEPQNPVHAHPLP
ncbi:DUF6296 family protein [Kitasatospora sp. NPDC056138]|uniref:DUF6296 family protein n=1 Tax=Kitasatospora sp. NPDC056138 TaxID=3345724 RepID=UPI0035DACF38